jgi:hypothetical protein
VIEKISADLTAIASPLLKVELHSLLNHLFIDETRSTNAGLLPALSSLPFPSRFSPSPSLSASPFS